MIGNFPRLKGFLKKELPCNGDYLLDFGILIDTNRLNKEVWNAQRITLEYYIKCADALLEVQVIHDRGKLKVYRVRIRYPNGEIKEETFDRI